MNESVSTQTATHIAMSELKTKADRRAMRQSMNNETMKILEAHCKRSSQPGNTISAISRLVLRVNPFSRGQAETANDNESDIAFSSIPVNM